MFSVMLSNGEMKTNSEIRRENLELAKDQVGSAAKLSQLIGTNPGYLSQIKNQTPDSKSGSPKTMGDEMARRIEAAIGVEPGWMDRDHSVGSAEPSKNAPNTETARTRGLLPLISWVQAGAWGDIVNIYATGDAEEWIPCPFNHGPNAFILRVVGLSMYNPGGDKSYAPGEYIAVDPNAEPLNKRMVVARMDHEEKATFKQLVIDQEGEMMLQALNPAYTPRLMVMPEGSTIAGVVIGKWVPEIL